MSADRQRGYVTGTPTIRELNSGRLVRPLADCEREVRYIGHFLVFSSATRQRHTIGAFREWLLRELGCQG